MRKLRYSFSGIIYPLSIENRARKETQLEETLHPIKMTEALSRAHVIKHLLKALGEHIEVFKI